MSALRFLLAPTVSLTCLLAPLSGSAATITESFSSPLDGVPEGWTTVIRNNAANDGAVSITPIANGTGNALRFHRAPSTGPGNNSSNANGVVYYTGAGGSEIRDFTAEITLRLGTVLPNSSTIGMMVRTQSLGYQFSSTPFVGYYVAVGETGLAIYENPTNNSLPGTLLALSDYSFLADTDYLFRVSAQGSTLEASIWDASGTTELAYVSYLSALETDGYIGFRNGFGNQGVTAYLRDLTVTVVPEPTSLLLTGMGALLAFHFSRKTFGKERS